jgi:hypothetical protein
MGNNNKIPDELMKAKHSVTQLRNLSLVMKMMFSTPENIMKSTNCTLDTAVEKIEKAYNFTNKYALVYLKDAVESLTPLVEEKLYEAISKKN